MPKGQHGGARPGAGLKKGAILKPTRDKAIAREALRAIIDKHMEAMTEAQIKNAQGINYLVKRAKVGGKFEKVSAEDLDAALQGQDDGSLILEIWAERPNVQSYTDLMNRHVDQPMKPVELSGNPDKPLGLQVAGLDAPEVITLPYKPRVWAKRLHASFCRWSALVLHRRAGKTTAIMNHHQRAALSDEWEMKRLRLLLPDASESTLRPLLARRNYWHVMPTYKQAKQVSWIMMKDYARPVPGVKFNESELKVTYPNGNIVQLIGGDDPDSLRGPALSGLSLDEFSQIPRESFSEVLSKALADHLGYCIFSGTIKGTDQLHQTYQAAKDDATWFSLWQNVDVSLATEEGPTLLAIARAMEDDRKLIQQGLMLQEEYDQEWFLSAEAAIKGAWFKKEMAAATTEGRITAVPYEPLLPVDTYWDLGIADAMSIWFAQTSKSGQVRLIDFYEATGEGFPHFIKMLREKPYVYGKHWAPHDIAVRELGTGKSRLETADQLGLKFQTAPNLPFDDGIAAARLLLSKCWFDATKCSVGVTSLRNYRKQFNSRLNEFTGTAVHDTFSHAADAFRYLAVSHKTPTDPRQRGSRPVQSVAKDAWMS